MLTLILKQLTKARQQGLKQYTKNILLCISIVLLSVNNVFAEQNCKSNIRPSTPTTRFTPQGDGTVLDTQTNLIWKRCVEGRTWNGATKSCDGTASTYTWQEALNVPQGNWRVPNIKELSSIVEIRCYGPAINLTVFPSGGPDQVWSSTPERKGNNRSEAFPGFGFDFGTGSNYYFSPYMTPQVLLVRTEL